MKEQCFFTILAKSEQQEASVSTSSDKHKESGARGHDDAARERDAFAVVAAFAVVVVAVVVDDVVVVVDQPTSPASTGEACVFWVPCGVF